MPTHSETISPNLEYYRKQAKALLKAVRSADPGAVERFSRQAVQFDPSAPKLHHAQLTLAREQGFPSWPRFRAFLVQSGLSDQGQIWLQYPRKTLEVLEHAVLSLPLGDLERHIARQRSCGCHDLDCAGGCSAWHGGRNR